MGRKKSLPNIHKRMGWRKDPYNRNPKMRKFNAKPTFRDKVILDQFLAPVRDQGDEGSCVGHGIGGVLTTMARELGLVDIGWFSPRWIYNGARALEGTIKEDAGCYPEDAAQWIRDKECLLDSIWPYIAGKDTFMMPPSQYDAEAAKYPCILFTRVLDGTNGICSAIDSGKYVAIGTPWYDEWMDTDKNGNLPEVDKYTWPAGGHETFAYGYDVSTKRFYCQNSWSAAWGNAGRFTMPFSAFDGFKLWGGYDAHIFDVDWVAPEPPEPPTPPEPPQPNGAARAIAKMANGMVKVFCPKSEIIARIKEGK